MSYSDTLAEGRQRLGVGGLISGSFGLFFRKFHIFMAIAILPQLVLAYVNRLLYADLLTGVSATDALAIFYSPLYYFILFLGVFVGIVISVVSTMAALDLRAGNRLRFGHYLSRSIVTLPLLILFVIIFYVMVMVGAVFLILPGLYLAACFGFFGIAIAVERVGFGGFSRSAALTKSYRWPLLGAGVLMFVAVFFVSAVVGAGLGFLTGEEIVPAGGDAFGGSIQFGVIGEGVAGAISTGLLAVFSALSYARLREIKEGVGAHDLAAVFA